jgi:hypothetical protein
MPIIALGREVNLGGGKWEAGGHERQYEDEMVIMRLKLENMGLTIVNTDLKLLNTGLELVNMGFKWLNLRLICFVGIVQALLKRHTEELEALYEKLFQEGKVEWVNNHGYFFVGMCLCSDLKMLKLMTGIGNGASVKQSCPFCDCEKDHMGNADHISTPRTADNLQPILKNISVDHVLLCGLHCLNRLAEKLLQMCLVLIWNSDKQNDGTAVLNILNNELNINGGYCKIEQKKKEGENRPGKIPLGGEDRVCNFLLSLYFCTLNREFRPTAKSRRAQYIVPSTKIK